MNHCLGVCQVCTTPLDSETGWTGELCSKINLLIFYFFIFLIFYFGVYFWISFWFVFGFLGFLSKLLRLLLKVTKVNTGHQKLPKQHKKPFFCPKGKKSLGRSPPQELEVGPRSGPYLLVCKKWEKFKARLNLLEQSMSGDLYRWLCHIFNHINFLSDKNKPQKHFKDSRKNYFLPNALFFVLPGWEWR